MEISNSEDFSVHTQSDKFLVCTSSIPITNNHCGFDDIVHLVNESSEKPKVHIMIPYTSIIEYVDLEAMELRLKLSNRII